MSDLYVVCPVCNGTGILSGMLCLNCGNAGKVKL